MGQIGLISNKDECPAILQGKPGKGQPQEPYRTTDGWPRWTVSTTECRETKDYELAQLG